MSTDRILKFRIWNGETKKMVYKNLWDMVWFLAHDLYKSQHHHLVFLQYTGLKDKNGKEIYEFDRVKTPAGIGEVKWDKCFRLFWNEKYSTTLHDCESEQLEVVGNVFES